MQSTHQNLYAQRKEYFTPPNIFHFSALFEYHGVIFLYLIYSSAAFLAHLAELFIQILSLECRCLSVCLDVNQGGTNRNHCTQSCNLACADLLIIPDHTPKTSFKECCCLYL